MASEDNSNHDYNRKTLSEIAKVKLDNMSKEFKELRRRVPLQHLTTPRSLFIQSVPENKCDVVITLTKGVPDSTLLWLLHKLRSSEPQLQVVVRQHTHTQCTAFYVTAEDSLLLRTAEEMHFPKQLREEYGGSFMEFTAADIHRFRNSESVDTFFSSQQRHALIKHVLMAARASVEDEEVSDMNKPADNDATQSDFGIGIKLRAGQCILPLCISQKVIESVFPLHDQGDESLLSKLKKTWVKQPLAQQPLDDIAEYFGVKVALYFAWLGHYTASLVAPAVIGLLTWVWLRTADADAKDMGQVIFSCFNILWAVIHLITWRRYSSVLAWRWGTLDMRDELLAEPRPQFQGTLQESPVTGRVEVTYPAWRRRLTNVFVSGPIILLCLTVAAFNTYAVLRFQDWWDSKLYYLSFIPRAMLALLIAAQDKIYEKIAGYLNDIENYRLETKYENHLIFKITLFQFVNSQMSLFYLAFYLEDMDKLTEQLAALLITRQILGNLKESALPYFREQLKYAKISLEAFGALTPMKEKNEDDKSNGVENFRNDSSDTQSHEERTDRSMGQAEVESQLFEYPGTFQEYSELMTQLCHVLLFSWACPPAAACALINNIIEIRTDAFKLCHVVKRPFAERVKSIGGWQPVMECVALAALMVNCFRVAFSSKVKSLDLVTLICVEHAVLLAVVLLHVLIPAVPEWLAEHMARIEYKRREAMNKSLIQNQPFQSLQLGRFTVKHSTTPTKTPIGAEPTLTSSSDEGTRERKPAKERKKMIIPEIPAFKPRAPVASSFPVSSTPSVTSTPPTARSILDNRNLLDPSPTKPTSHKDTQLTVLGVGPSLLQNLKASEHLHRSAQHIPSRVNKDIHSESRVSEPELTFASTSLPHAQLKTPMELKAALVGSSDVSSEEEKSKGAADARPAKQSRAKAALVKRARSVAVFSLRLRKAREAREAESKQPGDHNLEQALPAPILGGELNLIPIEKLIQMDDLSRPKLGN